MREKYSTMMARHQKEVNVLPIGFAFSNKQFEEVMAKWGLKPTDTDKVYKLGNTGGFYRKEDSDFIRGTLQRHARELEAAIDSDETGDGFIYDMFVCELFNHEYGYTGDPEEAVNACGYTMEEIQNDKKLSYSLRKACEYVMSCE